MGRWQPDAHGRLMEAAMDLFSERGFEQTTVAEIAARAGVTERTFFRYFPDKREVLFSGSEDLERAMTDALENAPARLSALDAVSLMLEHTAAFFEDRREYALRRRAVIESHAELRERERNKLASLSTAFAEALRARGVPEPKASVVAEMAVSVFHISFKRWLDDRGKREYLTHVREVLHEIRTMTA